MSATTYAFDMPWQLERTSGDEMVSFFEDNAMLLFKTYRKNGQGYPFMTVIAQWLESTATTTDNLETIEAMRYARRIRENILLEARERGAHGRFSNVFGQTKAEGERTYVRLRDEAREHGALGNYRTLFR